MFEDSTHGGRQRNRAGCVGTHHFNSRPHGGRPRPLAGKQLFSDISTHALTEGDGRAVKFCVFDCISTHALTEGDDSPYK